MSRRRSRYYEAKARRAEQQRQQDKAVRTTTQIATAGVLLAFAVTIVAVLEGPEGFAPLRPLAEPLIGPITALELIGTAFVAWVALILWRRLKR